MCIRPYLAVNEEKDIEDIFEEEFQSHTRKEEASAKEVFSIASGLPIKFHDDGTPVFERTDLIRPPIPLPGVNNPVIYQNLILPEHRALMPECRFNMIVLPPKNEHITRAWLGKSQEDPKTHLGFGRVLQAMDSTSRIVLQRMRREIPPRYGYIDDFIILNMNQMQLAIVPPNYEVEIVNFGPKPVRFFELKAKEEVRDIGQIKELNGMGYIVKDDGGLQPNSNYSELPIPRFQPGLDQFKFLKKRPLYKMFTQYPKGFDFIDPPDLTFFHGAL